MWVAKVKIPGEKGSIGKRTKKFNVSVHGYPVSSYKSGDEISVFIVAFINGEEEDKKKFIKDWKKDEKVVHIEVNNDLVIGQILEPPRLYDMYSHKFIHLEPGFIDEQGINYWTLGSWDRGELIKFTDIVEKEYDGELLSIKQEKIRNFSFLSMQPHLTKKQNQAMDFAIKAGYYDYPRKVSIQDLAKNSGLSFSTFHAHLRKAEQKLLPYSFNKVQEPSET